MPEQVILDSANDIFAWQSANGRAQIFGVGPPTRAIFFGLKYNLSVAFVAWCRD